MVNTKEIFEGIETSDLLQYLASGDNSIELKKEIERRFAETAKQRKNAAPNNTQLDAQYNG